MYDDLVKDLRENHDKYFARDTQAADAIEELSMKLHGANASIAGMQREIERMVVSAKPQWIPVTERLPKPTVVVQITDGKEVGHGYLVKTSKYYGWMSPFCDLDEDGITH